LRFMFRHWTVILSALLLISGCEAPKKTNSPNNPALTSGEGLKELFLPNDFPKTSFKRLKGFFFENGGTYNEENMLDRFIDQYGNSYALSYSYNNENEIACNIKDIPDMKILLPLRKYVTQLDIWPDSPITDITFLKNFHKLRELNIRNSTVSTFKPAGKLAGLESLRIDNKDPVTIDCSIFASLENLKDLFLSTDRVINLETIFDKTREEFKLPKFEYISLGENYSFTKNELGSLMSKLAGLTPGDKSVREKYGNKYGEDYIDQYGNKFHCERSRPDGISVDILAAPDMDVLLQLKNNITNLSIHENSPITDISFLKDFSRLKELRVRSQNILTLKSTDSLPNLDSLSVSLAVGKKFLKENNYTDILDFLLSFKNRDKLDYLSLIDKDIKDEDEMYVLAQEIFKISGIKGIGTDIKYFDRDYKKSFEFELKTYRILQYNANIRATPDRNGKVVAVLKTHDEVEILENTFIEEKINNVWGFWYKIKHGGVLGYTFGGNIAYNALASDIDKNGVKDYFYFRFSQGRYIEPNKDVIIYINGRRINTNVLSESKRYFDERGFEWCEFEENDGCVLIGLTQYGRHQYEYMHIFKVTPDGRIEFITNWNEIDYW